MFAILLGLGWAGSSFETQVVLYQTNDSACPLCSLLTMSSVV